MRFASWSAMLAVVVFVAPSSAQSWGPHAPGRSVHFSVKRVIIVEYVPFYGYGPFYDYSGVNPGFAPMPRFVLPPPADEAPPPMKEKVEKEKPIPFDPDGVLAIRPRPGGVKALPPPRQMPEPPPKVAPPNANVPMIEPAPRQAAPPERDKAAEAARQIKLGREAFADGEYGRAAERFRQAARVAPDDFTPTFFLAQAYFAMGKYRESVATIYDGMKMMPDWPKEPFLPRALYGEGGRDFPTHLDRLRQAVEREPDPALNFLYGYQLWFDGRRADAKPFLEKAAANVAEPKPIERFLNERN